MNKKKILEGLTYLSKYDGNHHNFSSDGFVVFGARTHKFKLNSVLSENDVKEFEQKHQIELPKDYFEFITTIGNGGAGPGYGLLPLHKWDKELFGTIPNDFLQTPFPHNKLWNNTELYDDDNEDEYSSYKYVTGAIRISHYGCGIMYMLIINGSERGHIWVDDRCSDYGIYSAQEKPLSFENWYMEWLEASINKVKQFIGGGN